MTLYALKRDLFLGGMRFRQQDGGTDIPDHIHTEQGIKKVVLANKERKYAEDEIPLPQDAELYDAAKTYAGRADKRLLGKQEPVKPVALSELPKHDQAAGAATEPKKK